MNYQLVQQLQEKGIPAQRSCRVLEASRAGYYGALERGKERKKLCTLTVQIKSVFAASGRCYGSRRLCRELNEQGVLIGRYKVRRLIRDHQLKPVWKRKFTHTTDSKHNLAVFKCTQPVVCANRRQPSLGCRYYLYTHG
jgi:putative transposase